MYELRKGISYILAVVVVLVLSIILLGVSFKILKSKISSFSFKENDFSLYFIYDIVNPYFLQKLKKSCQEENLDCVFIKKDELDIKKDGVYILLGYKSNPSFIKLLEVEEPVFFENFEDNKLDLDIITDNEVVVENKTLTFPKDSEWFLQQKGDFKFYMKILKGEVKFCFDDSCNKYIEVTKDGGSLKTTLHLSFVESEEYNSDHFSFAIEGRELGVKIGELTKWYSLSQQLSLKKLLVKQGTVIKEMGLFKKVASCQGECLSSSSDLAGDKFVNAVVIFDFLPYKRKPENYQIIFTNKFNFKDIKLDSNYNVIVPLNLLEDMPFKDLLEKAKEKFVGDFKAKGAPSILKKVDLVIVNNYEDLNPYLYKSLIGYLKYRDKYYFVEGKIKKEEPIYYIGDYGVTGVAYVKDPKQLIELIMIATND